MPTLSPQAIAKARRLVDEGPRARDHAGPHASVEGDHGTYVVLAADGAATCTCPAYGPYSHAEAVLTLAGDPQPTRSRATAGLAIRPGRGCSRPATGLSRAQRERGRPDDRAHEPGQAAMDRRGARQPDALRQRASPVRPLPHRRSRRVRPPLSRPTRPHRRRQGRPGSGRSATPTAAARWCCAASSRTAPTATAARSPTGGSSGPESRSPS